MGQGWNWRGRAAFQASAVALLRHARVRGGLPEISLQTGSHSVACPGRACGLPAPQGTALAEKPPQNETDCGIRERHIGTSSGGVHRSLVCHQNLTVILLCPAVLSGALWEEGHHVNRARPSRNVLDSRLGGLCVTRWQAERDSRVQPAVCNHVSLATSLLEDDPRDASWASMCSSVLQNPFLCT